jgi:hypothetical protein
MNPVRARSRAIAAALATSALVAAPLHTAPVAGATCFSIFGIGNGNGCTSNLTSYAIAIGEGAQADAGTGFFGGALAIGDAASAAVSASLFSFTTAVGNSAAANALTSFFSLAGQFGPGTASMIGTLSMALGFSPGTGPQTSSVIGAGNLAVQLGPGSSAALGGLNLVLGVGNGTGSLYPEPTGTSGVANLVVQLGPGIASAIGLLNLALGVSPGGTGAQSTTAGLLSSLALNLFGNGTVLVQNFFGGALNLLSDSAVEVAGILATAANFLGSSNRVVVEAGTSLLAAAFNFFGSNNIVRAVGPLAVAASVLQNGASLLQSGPGIALGLIFSPVSSAAGAASQALDTASSAASTGDGETALRALSRAPADVVDAFLYGHDPDGADGPGAAWPGLLSADHPLHQLLVAVPRAISDAFGIPTGSTGTITSNESDDASVEAVDTTPPAAAEPGELNAEPPGHDESPATDDDQLAAPLDDETEIDTEADTSEEVVNEEPFGDDTAPTVDPAADDDDETIDDGNTDGDNTNDDQATDTSAEPSAEPSSEPTAGNDTDTEDSAQ